MMHDLWYFTTREYPLSIAQALRADLTFSALLNWFYVCCALKRPKKSYHVGIQVFCFFQMLPSLAWHKERTIPHMQPIIFTREGFYVKKASSLRFVM